MKKHVHGSWLLAILLANGAALSAWEAELEFVRRIRSMQAPVQLPTFTRMDQMVSMSDGIRLQTSIYLPSSSGRFPAILVRTPYNDATDGMDDYGYSGIADYYVPRGYAVVIQTIRGKYASEGFYRLLSRGEIDDGAATVDWIAGSSWSDGKVAVIGVSHDGFDALAAGIRNPSALKLVISGGGPADLRTDAFLHSGTLATSLLDYIDFMFTETGAPYDSLFFTRMLTLALPEPRLRVYDNVVSQKQLAAWDELIGKMNTPLNSYWANRRIRDRLHECRVPIVQLAGLYGDGDMPDVVRNFEHLEANGVTSRLLMGWWDHGSSGPYGDVQRFTPPYVLARYDAYLDYYLKGIGNPLLSEKRVQVYAAGEGRFVASNTWASLPGYSERDFYFARGTATSGKLVSKPRAESDPDDLYEYDPSVLPTWLTVPGASQTRADQIVFLSEPSKADLPVCGAVDVSLYASSSARDTDFYVVLFVRQSDGQDRMLSPEPGLLQARQREGDYATPSLLVPGQVYAFSITAPFASGVIGSGERLGVAINSNLFPYVIRNANSGRKIGGDAAFQAATQTLYFGKTYPSKVTIRVRQ